MEQNKDNIETANGEEDEDGEGAGEKEEGDKEQQT